MSSHDFDENKQLDHESTTNFPLIDRLFLTFTNPGACFSKPRKVFGPVKPFLDHLCLKTEKCICSKFLV